MQFQKRDKRLITGCPTLINQLNDKGPSIYDVQGGQAHVDGGRGVQPHVDVHTEN